HLLLLPLCGVWGAILLCVGDIVSRTILAPQELPIGIITAGIGGLFIIMLLARNSP
ncbi:iron chelate uptake ABC transporter family permease subunit, partial [Klebsiella pneumoniae]